MDLTMLLLILTSFISLLDKNSSIFKNSKYLLLRHLPSLLIGLLLTISLVDAKLKQEKSNLEEESTEKRHVTTMENLDTITTKLVSSIDKIKVVQSSTIRIEEALNTDLSIQKNINLNSSEILDKTSILFERMKNSDSLNTKFHESILWTKASLITNYFNFISYKLFEQKDSIEHEIEFRKIYTHINELINSEVNNPVLNKNKYVKLYWINTANCLNELNWKFYGYESPSIYDKIEILFECLRPFYINVLKYYRLNESSFEYPPINKELRIEIGLDN